MTSFRRRTTRPALLRRPIVGGPNANRVHAPAHLRLNASLATTAVASPLLGLPERAASDPRRDLDVRLGRRAAPRAEADSDPPRPGFSRVAAEWAGLRQAAAGWVVCCSAERAPRCVTTH